MVESRPPRRSYARRTWVPFPRNWLVSWSPIRSGMSLAVVRRRKSSSPYCRRSGVGRVCPTLSTPLTRSTTVTALAFQTGVAVRILTSSTLGSAYGPERHVNNLAPGRAWGRRGVPPHGLMRHRGGSRIVDTPSCQNIVFELADDSGMRCRTSQCSTILPSSSRRKISMPAQSLSPGQC